MSVMANRTQLRNGWKILAFVVVTFVGDRVGGSVIERLFMNTKFRFAELYSGKLPSEIAFIGNSRGVHMFHRPPLQSASGRPIANLSFNGLPATMLPVVLEDYLIHHTAPQEVFVEVSCLGRVNEPGSLERFRIVTGQSASFDRVHRQSAPVDYAASEISHLYRCNSELLWRSVLFLRASDQDWIMTSVLRDDWKEVISPESIRRFDSSQADLQALQEMIQIADQHDVKVNLILAPYYPDYFELTEGVGKWLQRIEDQTGKKVLDYSTAIDQASLFADPIHLNPDGAARLSELMVKRGDLPRAN